MQHFEIPFSEKGASHFRPSPIQHSKYYYLDHSLPGEIEKEQYPGGRYARIMLPLHALITAQKPEHIPSCPRIPWHTTHALCFPDLLSALFRSIDCCAVQHPSLRTESPRVALQTDRPSPFKPALNAMLVLVPDVFQNTRFAKITSWSVTLLQADLPAPDPSTLFSLEVESRQLAVR